MYDHAGHGRRSQSRSHGNHPTSGQREIPLESEGTTREKTDSSLVLINEHRVGPQKT